MIERKKTTPPARKSRTTKTAEKLTPHFRMVKNLLNEPGLQSISSSQPKRRRRVVDAIEQRKLIENTALAQDITLKKITLFTLFVFLALETSLIFVFAFFQGVHSWGFALEEWSFKLLIAATVTQITLMVQIAVKHLFPQQKEDAPSAPAGSGS
jgi:hypothetical protein